MSAADFPTDRQLVRLSKVQPGDILVHPETGDQTLAQDGLDGVFVDDHGRTASGAYVYRKVVDPTLPTDLAGYQNVRRGFVLKGDLLIYDDGERVVAIEDDNEREIIGTGECPALHGESQNEPEAWGACRVYRKIPVARQGLASDGTVLRNDQPVPVCTTEKAAIDDVNRAVRETRECMSSYTPEQLAELHAWGVSIINGDGKYTPVEHQKAKTYDDGKAPLAYMPWAALDEMAMVQAYGKSKYGSFWNYRLGMEVGRNLSCAIRHIRDFMEGHDLDDESKRSHLGHAMCRIAFTLQNIKDGKAIDDRYKP